MTDAMNRNRVLIIIPAFNEQDTILKTVASLGRYIDSQKAGLQMDYVVVNDGSKDRTEALLEENRIPHICLLQNLGIGGAVQTGYRYAGAHGYGFAVQFDGDGQHDPTYLETILEPLMRGEADLCIGSRFCSADSSAFKSTAARRAGIKIISFMIKLVTGRRIYDPTSGFRAVNRKLIEHFSEMYPAEYPEPESIVEVLKLGYQVEERPVSMNERSGGQSSIRALKTVYYMMSVCLSILLAGLKGKKDLR